MGYVMVPVPEEHVEEAMHAVLRIATRARQEPWDQAAVTDVFHAVDEPTRSVLSAVARGVTASGSIADTRVADAIEYPQREVLGIVREVNERVRDEGRPPLVLVKMDTEVLPNGRTREARHLLMENDVTTFIAQAERDEAASSPGPLPDDAG